MGAIAHRPRPPKGCAMSAAAPSRWSDSSGCSASGLFRYAYQADKLQRAPGLTERRAVEETGGLSAESKMVRFSFGSRPVNDGGLGFVVRGIEAAVSKPKIIGVASWPWCPIG